jgi:hypothetical protein
MQQAIAAAPEYAELYDILAAAALLSGNLAVAVDSMEARLRLGNPTAFHIQLVSAIQAQFNQQQAAKIA